MAQPAENYLDFLERQFAGEDVKPSFHASKPVQGASAAERDFTAALRLLEPRSALGWILGVTRSDLEIAADRLARGLSIGPRVRVIKRALDLGLGGALLLLASPVIVITTILIRLSSPGPAFYRQVRIGQGGRPFMMWKMRTMYMDAPQRLAALADGIDPRSGILFKMARDPRVTPVGRIVRRLSLDELPQLWNVVRGDMSLVGPRPPLQAEAELYDQVAERRLQVQPGLTGLWQVSGRADLSWEDAIRLDLQYVDNWSITLDLVILWKTMRAVLGGVGSYQA